MMISISKITFVPVLLGVLVNSMVVKLVLKSAKFFVYIAMWEIIVIGIVVGLNHNALSILSLLLLLGIVLHNAGGLLES